MTSRVPQFMYAESPEPNQPTRCADGVVMPRPESRPVACDSGHARVPIRPTMMAVENRPHGFSARMWAMPVLRGGRPGISIFGLDTSR